MPKAKYGNPMNPKKRRKWKHNGALHIPELPQALVMDILSRVPFKTLCSCRCVCKDWLHITSDLHFAQLQFQRSPISILIKTQPHVRVDAQSKFELINVEKTDGLRRVRIDRMRFTPQKSIPCSLSGVDLINTCNGFICLSAHGHRDCRDGSLYVCNPILGQYISIPSPDNRWYPRCFTALGFSAKTKEYKVVQTCISECQELEAKIYTIGTGGWRSTLGKFPRGTAPEIPFNSFLHGALHWVQINSEDDDHLQATDAKQLTSRHAWIESFDFEREEFRQIQLPVNLRYFKYHPSLSLGVLKGCILLCVNGDNQTSDMWIMKDYGVQESWTKTLVIENFWAYGKYEPIIFFNDVEILMMYKAKCGSVVYYNQETKLVKTTSIIQTVAMFQAFGYHPCFVSLHDVSNGEEVKRIRDNNKIDILLGRGSGDDAFSGVPPDQKSGKLN